MIEKNTFPLSRTAFLVEVRRKRDRLLENSQHTCQLIELLQVEQLIREFEGVK